MNCSSNPYSDYNYPLFRIALQIEFGITFLFTVDGSFMIMYYSPPQKSKIFRFMIAKEIIIVLLFTMSIRVLATPITYLPYPAAEFVGLFRDFEVPAIAVLAIDLHLLFMIGASFAIMLIEYLVVLPLCLNQLFVQSQGIDMLNRLNMLGNALIPTGIFTYGTTYTPYRRAVLNMIPCLDHVVGYFELAIQRISQKRERESKVHPSEAVLKI